MYMTQTSQHIMVHDNDRQSDQGLCMILTCATCTVVIINGICSDRVLSVRNVGMIRITDAPHIRIAARTTDLRKPEF